MTPIVYDIETFPNCFTLSACELSKPETMFTWEISSRRDDGRLLLQWFNHLQATQTEMIGFNNLGFDYPIIHHMYQNADYRVQTIYALAQDVIGSNKDERFSRYTVWQSNRFAPQIDLFKIHHFDNKAKSTSLKALEVNMRSPSVEDMPVEVGTFLTSDQMDMLISYNRHDVLETDRFAQISEPNLSFRRQLTNTVKGDVLNFNDTKIGKQIIEQKLGDDLCYTRDANGKRVPRQTKRAFIRIADVIFPYISFTRPEFQRILDWLRAQTITETKGVFSDVEATVNGFTFSFGTGGIHGSVSSRRVVANDDFSIQDIDVAALYPSIAIENGLYPEHLGQRFVQVYRDDVRDERKKYAKGTVMNGALKLSANGAYGDSANEFSPLLDKQFTMAITINGQLMLCMLADALMYVPSLSIIQINTDGITYSVHRTMIEQATAICKEWEKKTRLILEYAEYSRMFIRDVNNYIAEDTKGKRKLKGAYWYPKKFPDDISNASPSAWYKDMSALVVQRAAEAAMCEGIDPANFIAMHRDPFDFMLRFKAPRGSQLMIGDKPTQRITRYYVARDGAPMRKISPPKAGCTPGDFKRKNGLTDHEYHSVRSIVPAGTWDARIHTANRSKYDDREMSVQSGWNVAECNVAEKFDWTNLNFAYYVQEAKKLIIQ